MTESCYKSFITTKTNESVPCFENGQTVESRYDPAKESSRLILDYDKNTKFFIVFGIAGGFLIQTILEQFEGSFVIGVEIENQSINFLEQSEKITKLKQNKNCILCSLNELEKTILNNYIPAFYGPLQIVQQRPWLLQHGNYVEQINSALQNAIENVKADYSVQSHFGKLWQNNILNNLKLIKDYRQPKVEFPLNKTAVVVAAGASLENQIKELINNRNLYYIISTDTAFSTLSKSNIVPDAVVSIDGQNISYSHFFNDKINFSDIIFAVDLCGNYNVVKTVLDNNGKLLMLNTGHPLCSFASDSFPRLYNGSGTVTITCLDFAVKAGFSKIKVIGADFSYTKNKPYTKGTYLENQYYTQNNKLATQEKQYDRLMYRTETKINSQNIKTSPVLETYKKSFIEYINTFGTYKYNDFVYDITVNKPVTDFSFENNFNYENFCSKVKAIKIPSQIHSFSDLNNEIISFLPLISYLRLYDNKDGALFIDFLNKAYSYTTGKL